MNNEQYAIPPQCHSELVSESGMYEKDNEFYPVEVKSADNTQAKSYKQFCSKYNPKKGIKLSTKNIARNPSSKTETYSIPLYMAWGIDYYIDSRN